MSKIKITLPDGEHVCNGKLVTFKMTKSCPDASCLLIEGVEYTLVDASGYSMTEFFSTYCNFLLQPIHEEGIEISVVLDTHARKAYLQNISFFALEQMIYEKFVSNYAIAKSPIMIKRDKNGVMRTEDKVVFNKSISADLGTISLGNNKTETIEGEIIGTLSALEIIPRFQPSLDISIEFENDDSYSNSGYINGDVYLEIFNGVGFYRKVDVGSYYWYPSTSNSITLSEEEIEHLLTARTISMRFIAEVSTNDKGVGGTINFPVFTNIKWTASVAQRYSVPNVHDGGF